MLERPAHRAAHPDDARLFSGSAVATLRTACEEGSYLLSRGYALSSVVDVVGKRHQLETRQRLAVQRSICSEEQRQARAQKKLTLADVNGQELLVDGFNLIIGLEVALSGGVLLRGRDGALRDLAGLRGSYRPVVETEAALELIAELLRGARPAQTRFLLDAPVSNSGRLRERIVEHELRFAGPVSVELVANPDRALEGKSLVVSGDSVVLDRCQSWIDLLGDAVLRLPSAWLIDLS